MSRLNLGDSFILDTDYSTTEKKTGATWIDGKPIYRKVFTGTTYNSYISGTVISDLKDVISLTGILYSSTTARPICYGEPSAGDMQWQSGVTYHYSNGLKVVAGTSVASANPNWRVIIEYTKTTD